MMKKLSPLSSEYKPFLDFYEQHNISPVSQDVSNLEKHFTRRSALYQQLGLVPMFFQDKTVIEFGPGSGHNAIFTNSLKPSRYVLVDGNSIGLENTQTLLAQYFPENKNYEVVSSLFEEYSNDDLFDFVLCEGVIPQQRNPQRILKHVANFAKAGGVLVITCADSVSLLGDILRRLASFITVSPEDSTENKLKILSPLIQPHLSTLNGMSRPVKDWILDAILQPFVGKWISIKEAIDTLSPEFEVYGASPQIFTDWRWYKDIPNEPKANNNRASKIFCENVHNLLDYRYSFPAHPIESNYEIIKICDSISELVRGFEQSYEGKYILNVQKELHRLCEIVQTYSPNTADALSNFNAALKKDTNPFLHFSTFTNFFGRGQQYLSFIRKVKHHS